MSEEPDEEVKRRIERNRQAAIILRKSKPVFHPYAKQHLFSEDTTTIQIGSAKYKDTGGGFLLEEQAPKKPAAVEIRDEAPIIEPDRPTCEKCSKTFATSWLFEKFSFNCCDLCKDPEIHKLITKTEAKETYLLKDCDLDKRDPPLKFIKQKNPHNHMWGDMKLYLLEQVKNRALEVWGSEEEIEKERERRDERRISVKSKKHQKWLKELKMDMRSSLFDRTSGGPHTHEFGPETYNEDDDTYHRKCTTCPYEETFEKM